MVISLLSILYYYLFKSALCNAQDLNFTKHCLKWFGLNCIFLMSVTRTFVWGTNTFADIPLVWGDLDLSLELPSLLGGVWLLLVLVTVRAPLSLPDRPPEVEVGECLGDFFSISLKMITSRYCWLHYHCAYDLFFPLKGILFMVTFFPLY